MEDYRESGLQGTRGQYLAFRVLLRSRQKEGPRGLSVAVRQKHPCPQRSGREYPASSNRLFLVTVLDPGSRYSPHLYEQGGGKQDWRNPRQGRGGGHLWRRTRQRKQLKD
jgi:hypothetical protein